MASVPRGVTDGIILRMKGKGNQSGKNTEAGDLLLKVKIKNTSNFSREGQNIHSVKQISVTQAILGGSASIKTIDGDEQQITIDPSSTHGT